MKRRLARLEVKIIPKVQRIVILQQSSETHEDMDARVKRWKAGEVVERIDGVYEGGEVWAMYVSFVAPGQA